jgi:hypothetical protein
MYVSRPVNIFQQCWVRRLGFVALSAISITDSEYVLKVEAFWIMYRSTANSPAPPREQDMRKINNYPHYLYRGTRCYLIMMQLAGTLWPSFTTGARRPNTHDSHTHEDERSVPPEPVFTCVYNQKTQTLIVDDLIAMNGTVIHQQNLRPDPRSTIWYTSVSSGCMHLPLKVEVRKYFAYSQLGECLDLVKCSTTRRSACPNRPNDQTRDDCIIPPPGVSCQACQGYFRSGNFMVTKGDAPDLYHVALEHTSAPLVVKTLKDSLALAKMFKVSPDNAVRMDLVERR